MPLVDVPLLPSDTASSSSSSSSSPPASPLPLRHRLRRKRSPSPSSHVPRFYSHHFAFTSRPYSPSSREADIARLLDPAYASPAPQSPLSKSPKMAAREVYVDHHGDLHDPDFRDFPPFGPSRHPRWDRTFPDDDDDSDDEDYPPRRSSFDAQRRRPSSTVTYRPPPVYYPYEEPASYESRYLAEEEDEEADQFERAPLEEKSFRSRARSPRPKSHEEKRSPFTAEGDQVIQADSEWTPTCTQNLRRHWQAICLSFRFTLFRTKRRLRRRLTG